MATWRMYRDHRELVGRFVLRASLTEGQRRRLPKALLSKLKCREGKSTAKRLAIAR